MSAKLTCIGSSSHGNGYLLQCGDESLIIECGMSPDKVLPLLNWDISGVAACIVTHSHSDHAKFIRKYKKYGLPIYSNQSVREKYSGVRVLEPKKRYAIGGFKVMPLLLEHNVECYGYVIDHSEMGRLVFCTDAKTLPYCLPNVNVLMIEANYSEELIIDRLCEGKDIRSHFNAHMELAETIKVIKRLYNPNMRNVILIHLSDGNSDEQMFKDKIFSETGFMCEIANAGSSYELKEDF